MNKVSNLAPDKALAALIDGEITVELSATDSRTVPIYRQGSRPSVDAPEEFIEVLHNGIIRAMTHPLGVFRGNLAVVVYCKAFANGTAKFDRIESIMGQLEGLVDGKESGKVYFEVDSDNLITPVTYDAESGYSIVILNIEWHTTE